MPKAQTSEQFRRQLI